MRCRLLNFGIDILMMLTYALKIQIGSWKINYGSVTLRTARYNLHWRKKNLKKRISQISKYQDQQTEKQHWTSIEKTQQQSDYFHRLSAPLSSQNRCIVTFSLSQEKLERKLNTIKYIATHTSFTDITTNKLIICIKTLFILFLFSFIYSPEKTPQTNILRENQI